MTRLYFVITMLLGAGACTGSDARLSPSSDPVTSSTLRCERREPTILAPSEKGGITTDFVVRVDSESLEDQEIAETVATALEAGRFDEWDADAFSPDIDPSTGFEGLSIFEIVDEPREGCGSEFLARVGVGARSASLVFVEVRMLRPRCDLALIRVTRGETSWLVDDVTPAETEMLEDECADHEVDVSEV